MRYSQHDDSPRDAGQLPSGVIFARGTGDLSSVPSHAPTPVDASCMIFSSQRLSISAVLSMSGVIRAPSTLEEDLAAMISKGLRKRSGPTADAPLSNGVASRVRLRVAGMPRSL